MKISSLPPNLRPREKAWEQGIETLDDAELLALLIRAGTKEKSALELSVELLSRFLSLKGVSEASVKELSCLKGLSKTKAITLLAGFELGKRCLTKQGKYHYDPKETYLRGVSKLEQKESLWVIGITSRGEVGSGRILYQGNKSTCLASQEEIIKEILNLGYPGFVLIHGHPSGVAFPSESDLLLTKNLSISSKQLSLRFEDHLIITEGGYFSFAENGLRTK